MHQYRQKQAGSRVVEHPSYDDGERDGDDYE
jgi:hypothetical protein